MAFKLSDRAHRRGQRPAAGLAPGGLRAPGAASSRRRGVDIERLTERGHGLSGGGALAGAWAPGGRASPASRDPASPATSSRSWRTARRSTAWCASPPGSRSTSRGTGPRARPSCKAAAEARGLFFDSMNSNTFQDQPDQKLSYKFGSLTHTDRGRARAGHRPQPRVHGPGPKLGARSHTVWIGDGGNFPGQQHFRRALDRYLESLRAIYRALPDGWRLFIEHKLYEPAFYSTVLNDWGISYHCATRAGRPGVLAGGPRPPRAERQHRDDRGPAHPVREAGRLPLQRQQVRRRRPRRGLDQALPALPGLQRARGRGARGGARVRPRLHARPVAQRDRPHRVADGERHRGGAGLRAGPPGRPRRRSPRPRKATTRSWPWRR